jgi:hypothetical protein
MNNAIKSLAFLAAAASFSMAASAATYYVSDCQSGAASGCVAGNDSNAGTSASAPWRTTAPVQSKFSSMAAGDKILFAKGGVWVNASMVGLQNLNARPANPITFDSYTPSWGATAKPILNETRKDTDLFNFSNGMAPVPDGGYVVQNLELRGGGSGADGVWISAGVNGLIMQNLTIDGFSIGVMCGDDIENVKLLNSKITNSRNQGTLWACNNSLVDGNTWDNNGSDRPVYDHSIYISGSPANNITFRNNTITNSSADDNGICQAVIIVVHGAQSGLVIENNTLYQAPGKSGLGCWGIAVDPGYGDEEAESFDKVVIRGNSIINAAGIGIGCAGCRAPLIENNVLVIESAPDMIGIRIPDRTRPTTNKSPDNGGIIRNNSIYFASTPGYSLGISVAEMGSSTAGSNLQVVSNLIYFGPGSNNHQCFDTGALSKSNFTAFDNNLCYHAGGNGVYSFKYATLAAAKAAGFDTNGKSDNPKITVPTKANNFAMTLAADSPAVNAGNATLSSTVDRLLSTTRLLPDIGAFEYSNALDKLAPAAPPSLIVN